MATDTMIGRSATADGSVRPFRVDIPEAAIVGGDPDESPTKDQVLDDFSLYWLTNTATSAGRLYWENHGAPVVVAPAQKTSEISVPVAVTVFPEDVYRPPESWAKRAFPNLVYFNEVDRGGHFAAWQHPQLFCEELRSAFSLLR
jgi:pimeloyl-ACP methyl ester carboxylesterase